MKDLAPGVQLVEVRERADPDNSTPARLWVAVVPRDSAVAAVQALVPADWHVTLSQDYPTREFAASLNLRLGDVREIGEPT